MLGSSDQTLINYAVANKSESKLWVFCGIAACCVALIATVVPIPSILRVASYPPGASIRPMRAVGMQFLGGAAGLLIALPLALICLVKGRFMRVGVILGVISVMLALVAVFGDLCLFRYIVASGGYIMEE